MPINDIERDWQVMSAKAPKKPREPKMFYLQAQDLVPVKRQGRWVTIKGFEDFDFFITWIEPDRNWSPGWRITEASTGKVIVIADCRKDPAKLIIKRAANVLSEVGREGLAKAIERTRFLYQSKSVKFPVNKPKRRRKN